MTTEAQRKRWVANYFGGKVGEFSHYLSAVIAACDASFDLYKKGEQQTQMAERSLLYSFSSFSNGIQTLKDAGSVFLKPTITWGNIKTLRHGEFFYLSRNAATHDGNPIISAWSDGRYFVPANISRLDDKKNIVTIPAPTTDVRTFCLEFSCDLVQFLKDRLQPVVGDEDICGFAFDTDVAALFMRSQVVPQFARDLFTENIDQIRTALAGVKNDPIQKALDDLDVLMNFCVQKLGSRASSENAL